MAVTGAMMAFETQILEAADRAVLKVEVPETAARKMNAVELAGKITQQKPGSPAVSGMTVKSDPAASVVVFAGRDKTFYVNPYTGEILGEDTAAHRFMHGVEDIHRRLALKDAGLNVTHAANAFFCFLVISGFILWWPRNWAKNALKQVLFFNPELKGRARDWNWHNVIGFWCWPLLLITTLTGLVMSYGWANSLLFRLAGSEPPAQQLKMGGPKPESGKAPDISLKFEEVFEQAALKAPDWKTISVRAPRDAGGPFMAFIQHRNAPGFMRSKLTLAPGTSEVKWEPFGGQSRGQQARIWARALHVGEAGGWIGQLLAFLAGSGAALLVWTGFAMAWRRFFTRPAAGNKI